MRSPMRNWPRCIAPSSDWARTTGGRRCAGDNNGFSNMHQLMTDLHQGRRKSLPCGAGVGLLAVDGDGDLNLCHRFTGSELADLRQCGHRHRRRAPLAPSSRRRSTARARIARPAASAICARAAATTNRMRDSATPTTAPIITATCCGAGWISECGIYADIQRHNPSFFTRHLEPRSAIA